jgi:hypothetical protein
MIKMDVEPKLNRVIELLNRADKGFKSIEEKPLDGLSNYAPS